MWRQGFAGILKFMIFFFNCFRSQWIFATLTWYCFVTLQAIHAVMLATKGERSLFLPFAQVLHPGFFRKKPAFPKRPHQRNGLCTEMEPENGACPSTASSSIAFIMWCQYFANLYTSSTFPLWFHISGFEVPHTCQESQNCKAASDQQLEGRVEAKGLWSLSLRFFNQLQLILCFFEKKGAFQSVNPRNFAAPHPDELAESDDEDASCVDTLSELGSGTSDCSVVTPQPTSRDKLLSRLDAQSETWSDIHKDPCPKRTQSDLLKVAMSLKKAFESTAESKQTPSVTPSVPQESALRSEATLSKKYELPLHVTCQNVSTYNLTTIQWCSIYWEMNCLGCLIVI